MQMNGIEVIRASLVMGHDWLQTLLADMKEAPLTQPGPNGGNHPMWVVGHLAHSEASLVAEFILGEKNPLAKWDKLFGMGSKPATDAAAYPPFEEVLGELEKARARTLSLLDSYTDADLDRAAHVPDEYKEMFGTVGKCFACLSVHEGFHAGQVADARRAAGKAPVYG
jgi:hypothetical protein